MRPVRASPEANVGLKPESEQKTAKKQAVLDCCASASVQKIVCNISLVNVAFSDFFLAIFEREETHPPGCFMGRAYASGPDSVNHRAHRQQARLGSSQADIWRDDRAAFRVDFDRAILEAFVQGFEIVPPDCRVLEKLCGLEGRLLLLLGDVFLDQLLVEVVHPAFV